MFREKKVISLIKTFNKLKYTQQKNLIKHDRSKWQNTLPWGVSARWLILLSLLRLFPTKVAELFLS